MNIKFRCCFCGEGMKSGDTDLCSLTLTTADEQSQTQFCHLDCFVRATPHCDIYVTGRSHPTSPAGPKSEESDG